MSKEKIFAPSKEAANKLFDILSRAGEDGCRAAVSALPEAEQYGGTVITIIAVPFDEDGNKGIVQGIISNCHDQETVHRTILEVAIGSVTKRQARTKEAAK